MGPRPPRALALAFAVAVGAPLRAAGAEPPPSSTTTPEKGVYSHYEQESLDAALAKIQGVVDPSPEGKVIEGVEVVTLDVFEPRDFIPKIFLGFVNWFHVTTRPHVIEREVLLPAGARYEKDLIAETARNLRGLSQLSLVLCVPVKGSAPGRVKLLVIAKDVWSLRLNTDYLIADGKLLKLTVQPNEENFLGTHQSLLGTFMLDQGRYTFGGRYTIPRIAGSRIGAEVDANVLVNRDQGTPEGSYGRFFYGQPLYSTQARWAWEGQIDWRHEITRQYIGAKPRTFNATATKVDDQIPYEYRSDLLSGHYAVTRSFGAREKYDVTFGLSASRNVYRSFDLSAFDPAAQREFVRKVMPVSDTQIGPFVQLHAHSLRYVSLLDLNTLGLQEDFLLGHDVYLKLSPASTRLLSSRDYLEVYAAAAYTFSLGDGLARFFVESTTEIAADSLPDASIEAGTRIASPRTPIGRLHFDARVLSRYRNYLNATSTLGGDTRLRGYRAQEFIGKDLVMGTLEFRSRAAQILGCQVGGAAFFDTGDAFDGFADLRLKQSAGFGIRILFPQLDRTVMRVDWGFPLTRGAVPSGGFPGDIVLTFRQAFVMPVLPVNNLLR